ncbi:MAG: hypothetical protein DHS20C15_28960 [Planctomycetota bacterium]|nr:MAG: hypothetical protein DHS20C15_28960 [Planctomycetota bacterium]
MKARSDTGDNGQPLSRALHQLGANPEALRIAVCLALLVLGLMLVLNPLGERLAEARDDLVVAGEQLKMAEAARHHTNELERIRPRVAVGDDLSEWQAWVLQRVQAAGLTLLSFEPRGTDDTRGFRLLEFDVSATARDYQQAVDLVDRLEHGDRLLRVVALQIDANDRHITVTATLLGLVSTEFSAESDDA